MRSFLTPVVMTLIGVNLVLFLLQQVLLAVPSPWRPTVPIELGAMVGVLAWHGQYYRLVTALFLHATWAHLLFNMLALLSFGYTVERAYGKVAFLFLFLAGGVLSNGFYGLLHPRDACIGASGAVATVLMLSAMKYPSQVVIFLVAPMPIRVFAVLYVLIESWAAIGNPVDDGIAHFAHLGGLAVGFLFFTLFDGKVERRIPVVP